MIPALWTSPPLTAEESARWTTSEERAAAAGFVSERRRAEFLTWRAVVRRELGDDVGIAYDALGAPVLTNRAVHISVAHCAGRIAVCASPERCAVDIEPATRDFRRAASRYLTPEEEALSDDPLLPGIVWCAKRDALQVCRTPGAGFPEGSARRAARPCCRDAGGTDRKRRAGQALRLSGRRFYPRIYSLECFRSGEQER